MKKLVNTAFLYAVLAMAGGVFYREFTKLNGFTGTTALSVVHTHLFLLGMFFTLLVLLLDRRFRLSGGREFVRFFLTYNCGVALTAVMLVARGIPQVLGTELSRGLDASISGISGVGHILTGLGMIFFFLLLKKRISAES